MASVKNVISDWTADRGERHDLYHTTKGLVLRWLNEAQLRFCDKSEVLRGLWEPTLDASGTETLPPDFLREFVNKVKWSDEEPLIKGDYHALRVENWGTTSYYAIYGGKFYVFAAAAGSPTIPYVRKPEVILGSQIDTAELEIPTEYHHELILFLDAMFARRQGDVAGYMALLKEFDANARQAGVEHLSRTDAIQVTMGGLF